MTQRQQIQELFKSNKHLSDNGTMRVLGQSFDDIRPWRAEFVDITLSTVSADGLVEYSFFMQLLLPVGSCVLGNWRLDEMQRQPMVEGSQWKSTNHSFHNDLESCFDLANQIAQTITNQN